MTKSQVLKKLHREKPLFIMLFKLALISIFATVIILVLNYPSIDSFRRDYVDIYNSSDLTKINGRKDKLRVHGTVNTMFKVTDDSGSVYFALTEYGSDLLVKDTYFPAKDSVTYTGKLVELSTYSDHQQIISLLNDIEITDQSDALVSEVWNVIDEDLKDSITQNATGEFSKDSFILIQENNDREVFYIAFEIAVEIMFLSLGVCILYVAVNRKLGLK